MGKVVGDFIKTQPKVRAAEKTVTLPVNPDEYLSQPW